MERGWKAAESTTGAELHTRAAAQQATTPSLAQDFSSSTEDTSRDRQGRVVSDMTKAGSRAHQSIRSHREEAFGHRRRLKCSTWGGGFLTNDAAMSTVTKRLKYIGTGLTIEVTIFLDKGISIIASKRDRLTYYPGATASK